MKIVKVAVGVVLRDTSVFVCLRPEDKHQGGKWEFPGGKVDDGESVEQALIRELREEIDIQVTQSEPLITVDHDYGDKKVSLCVYTVSQFEGSPHGKEGQKSKWLALRELNPDDFPKANVAIIEELKSRL